ncbi:MAG: galactokinase family protein [Vicinamibacterales bacterium]
MIAALESALVSLGLSGPAANELAGIFEQVAAALLACGVARSRCRFLFVPGRIELLGKHTDYAGGRSLLCAIDHGICLMCAPRPDDVVDILDVGWREERVFSLDPALRPPSRDWSNYPMTTARRVARNFPAARHGTHIAFRSTLPPASGLSSSSALLTASFLAIAHVNRLEESPQWSQVTSLEDVAEYLGAVENGQSFRGLEGDRGVGTFGGSEDHTAMLCCRSGEFSMYSFSPVRRERQVSMPSGHVLAVAFSGVKAEKTGAAQARYNLASRAVEVILEQWRKASGRDDRSLAAAVRSSDDAPARIREAIARGNGSPSDGLDADRLLSRFEQFVEESEYIVPRAALALAGHRLDDFGKFVDRSQHNAERLLGNQVPETVFLARTAREAGAVAASAFGAGFGGSVWAMLPAPAAPAFLDELAARYRAAFPHRADAARFFVTAPGPAASWLDTQ